jgi:hypothetical protein
VWRIYISAWSSISNSQIKPTLLFRRSLASLDNKPLGVLGRVLVMALPDPAPLPDDLAVWSVALLSVIFLLANFSLGCSPALLVGRTGLFTDNPRLCLIFFCRPPALFFHFFKTLIVSTCSALGVVLAGLPLVPALLS